LAFHGVISVAPAEASEVGLFERDGGYYEESPKERDDRLGQLPVALLAQALARCEHFQRHVAEVAEHEDRAWSIAQRYVRSGAGRRVVERFLIEASRVQPDRVETTLANLGGSAVWVKADLETGDARYDLRTDRESSSRRGATFVARRGAGGCIRCGSTYNRTDRYCAKDSPATYKEERKDDYDSREVLRAAAEQLGIESSGPRRRRVRRS